MPRRGYIQRLLPPRAAGSLRGGQDCGRGLLDATEAVLAEHLLDQTPTGAVLRFRPTLLLVIQQTLDLLLHTHNSVLELVETPLVLVLELVETPLVLVLELVETPLVLVERSVLAVDLFDDPVEPCIVLVERRVYMDDPFSGLVHGELCLTDLRYELFDARLNVYDTNVGDLTIGEDAHGDNTEAILKGLQ